MIREVDIREKLAAVWRNDISLLQFEDWLAPASWSMHRDSSQETIALVSSIHALLSERDDHVIDEAELRRQFLALLNNIKQSVTQPVEPVIPLNRAWEFSTSNAAWLKPPPVPLLPV
ncbi:MAG TPA: hypothetical protein VGK99_17755 [Acidobacteriota bacterium]|jgi:hypothetical protein